MSNNKQSSIEWLCEKLALKLGTPMAISFYIDHAEEIKQAKAMREKEIKDAFDAGEKNVLDQYSNPMTKVITSEQYYNETFNNKT